uniref:Uncharacterized protein n=1 Tax=Oryza punctata TaxID=4537 RepID=A0A0E0KPQ4_ORYPU
MERNAAIAIACTLLLAAATTTLLPAATAANLVAGKYTATAAALGSTVAPWVVDDAGVGGMMMVAAAAGSVEYGHGEGGVVHRRVLQARGGGYVNPSLVANRQSCTRSCPARGGSYTGRGNKCIYQTITA